MFHLRDLPHCLHWPHTGVIACRDLSAQFNTKKGEELAREKANGHVASRRVYDSYPQPPCLSSQRTSCNSRSLALLQDFCKHRNWTPAAIAPKHCFRVSCGSSAQRRNQSIKSLLQPGLADSGFMHHQQDPDNLASYPATMYLFLPSSTLKRHSLLSHSLHRSYSMSTFILAALL